MIYATFVQGIMKDPVVCQDGHTYERAAIVEWLDQHGTSPQVRSFCLSPFCSLMSSIKVGSGRANHYEDTTNPRWSQKVADW